MILSFYFFRNISKCENNDVDQCNQECQKRASALPSLSQPQCPSGQSTVLDNSSSSTVDDYEQEAEIFNSNIRRSGPSLHRRGSRDIRANYQNRDHGEWVVSETLTPIPCYTQSTFHRKPRSSSLPPIQHLPEIPQRCRKNRPLWLASSGSQAGPHSFHRREGAYNTECQRSPSTFNLQRHSIQPSSSSDGCIWVMHHPDRGISLGQPSYPIDDSWIFDEGHRRSGHREAFTPRGSQNHNLSNEITVDSDEIRDIYDSKTKTRKDVSRDAGNDGIPRKARRKPALKWNSHSMASNWLLSENPENMNLRPWHEVCQDSQCHPKSRSHSEPLIGVTNAHLCNRLSQDPINAIGMEIEQTRNTPDRKSAARVNGITAFCKNVIPRRPGSDYGIQQDSQWHSMQHTEPPFASEDGRIFKRRQNRPRSRASYSERVLDDPLDAIGGEIEQNRHECNSTFAPHGHRKKSPTIYAIPPREARNHAPQRKSQLMACDSSFCQELDNMNIRSDAETYQDSQNHLRQRCYPTEPWCVEDGILLNQGHTRSYRQPLVLDDPLDETAVELEQTRNKCKSKSTHRAKKTSKHGRQGKSNFMANNKKCCQDQGNDEFRLCDEACQDFQCDPKYRFSQIESSSATGNNLMLNGGQGFSKEPDSVISRVSEDQLSAIDVTSEQTKHACATEPAPRSNITNASIKQVIPIKEASHDVHQRTSLAHNSTLYQDHDTVNPRKSPEDSQFHPSQRFSRMELSPICERGHNNSKDTIAVEIGKPNDMHDSKPQPNACACLLDEIQVKEERPRKHARQRKLHSIASTSACCRVEKSCKHACCDPQCRNIQPMEKPAEVRSKSMICPERCCDKVGRPDSLEIDAEGSPREKAGDFKKPSRIHRPRCEKPMNHNNDSTPSSTLVMPAEEESGGECDGSKTDRALQDFLEGKAQNRRQAICKEIEKTLNLVKLNGLKMSLYELRKDLCKLVGDRVFQGIHEEEG